MLKFNKKCLPPPKKSFHDSDNHDGVNTQLEPDTTKQQSKSLRLQTFSSSIGLNIKQTAMFHLKKNKTEFERPELEVHC